jgi:hypothetical protein
MPIVTEVFNTTLDEDQAAYFIGETKPEVVTSESSSTLPTPDLESAAPAAAEAPAAAAAAAAAEAPAPAAAAAEAPAPAPAEAPSLPTTNITPSPVLTTEPQLPLSFSVNFLELTHVYGATINELSFSGYLQTQNLGLEDDSPS